MREKFYDIDIKLNGLNSFFRAILGFIFFQSITLFPLSLASGQGLGPEEMPNQLRGFDTLEMAYDSGPLTIQKVIFDEHNHQGIQVLAMRNVDEQNLTHQRADELCKYLGLGRHLNFTITNGRNHLAAKILDAEYSIEWIASDWWAFDALTCDRSEGIEPYAKVYNVSNIDQMLRMNQKIISIENMSYDRNEIKKGMFYLAWDGQDDLSLFGQKIHQRAKQICAFYNMDGPLFYSLRQEQRHHLSSFVVGERLTQRMSHPSKGMQKWFSLKKLSCLRSETSNIKGNFFVSINEYLSEMKAKRFDDLYIEDKNKKLRVPYLAYEKADITEPLEDVIGIRADELCAYRMPASKAMAYTLRLENETKIAVMVFSGERQFFKAKVIPYPVVDWIPWLSFEGIVCL